MKIMLTIKIIFPIIKILSFFALDTKRNSTNQENNRVSIVIMEIKRKITEKALFLGNKI